MSLFIHAIIMFLFVLLVLGIGVLVLVCWALAVCAGRYDHCRDEDYRVK